MLRNKQIRDLIEIDPADPTECIDGGDSMD